MKDKNIKLLGAVITLLICAILIVATAISSSALSWVGSSSGGGGNASTSTSTGYAIWNDTEDTVVVGYRFSVVNSSGNTSSEVIDIYRDTTITTTTTIYSDYKYSTKYNKSQLIDLQNTNFATRKTSFMCYDEDEFGISMPDPSDMDSWATWEDNIDPILNELGYTSGASSLASGEMVIVEPIYRVKLASTYHSLTLTELALYGKYLFGATSDGGSSSSSDTWGFISNYTNMYFANWLYTSDSMGLWTNASKLSSRATFYTLINSGYGVGIVYTSTTANTGSIVYNANGGSLSSSTYSLTGSSHIQNSSGDKFFDTLEYNVYNNPWNATTFGLSQTGYTFVGWNTASDGSGTFIDQNTDYLGQYFLSSLSTSSGGYVILYAQWEANTGSIVYNANGGSLSSSTYSLTGSSHIQNSSGDKFFDTLEYNVYNNPWNATTFGLSQTGYTFVGWNTAADGSGTFIDQSTDYLGQYFLPDLATSSGGYVILYAIWEGYTGSIVYNANGGTLSSSTYSLTGYSHIQDSSGNKFFHTLYNGTNNTPYAATVFGLTKTGYTFVGWNTAADGNGTMYYVGTNYAATDYLSSLSTSSGGYVILYAQWEVNVGSIVYNANAGTLSSLTYSLTGYKHIQDSSGDKFFHKLVYGTTDSPYSNSFFDLSYIGYSFVGWNTAADGSGTMYSVGTNYAATDYVSSLSTSSGGYVILYAQWSSSADIYPEYIEPNSDYRQGTTVVISFNIVNESDNEFTANTPINVTFSVVSTNSSDVDTLIYTSEQEVIVPSHEQNLVYFKVEIPDDSKKLTLQISSENNYYYEINYENNTSLIEKEVATVINSQTTDTIFTSTPSSFYLPSLSTSVPTFGMVVDNEISWDIWEWVDGDFQLNTYGITFNPTIAIEVDSNTSSVVDDNNLITMKSGYGFEFSSTIEITSSDSYLMPSSDSYTTAQNGAVFFPEYSYSSSVNEYRTLELNNNLLTFEENAFSISSIGTIKYNRLHYIPVYYPDTSYIIKSIIYDVWTPAGMIAATTTTNSITINGSIYDDWYAH